jgi:hypothetical protein
MRPKSWPQGLVYARESIACEVNMSFLRHCLNTGNPEDLLKQSWVIAEKCVHPSLLTKKVQPSHPLYYQKTPKGHVNYGVFAQEKIERGIELGEYVGGISLRNIRDFSCDHKFPSAYLWTILLNGLWLIIDGQIVSNELALVNDYRGISSAPNVEMRGIIHQGLIYFGYVTVKEIQKDEEVLVYYGHKFCT